jgi:hypothetical protein
MTNNARPLRMAIKTNIVNCILSFHHRRARRRAI